MKIQKYKLKKISDIAAIKFKNSEQGFVDAKEFLFKHGYGCRMSGVVIHSCHALVITTSEGAGVRTCMDGD